MQLRRLASVIGGLLVGAVACSTAPIFYPEHPLSDQILKVREGFENKLTNLACVPKDDPSKPDEAPDCPKAKVTAYPIFDPEFRKTVNRLNFICNVGGKRYKICLDKPGFCRFSAKQECFLGLFCKDGERSEIEYLPVEKYRFLLDANARCANKEKYDLWKRQ